MTDETKLVPCSVCGHKVVELDGALYHFVGGDFANERCSNSFQHVRPDLAPCSSCGEGGYLITLPDFASNNMYVEGRVKCSICRMVCNVKDWNRLHGGHDLSTCSIKPVTELEAKLCCIISELRQQQGTWIEVEGCDYRCPFFDETENESDLDWICQHPDACDYFEGKEGSEVPVECPLRRVNQGPTTISIKEVE